MIDTVTQERITVLGDEIAGPYIMLPLEQLDAVEAVLRANQVSYWVDVDAISINGKPEMVVIDLGRGTSTDQIQRLLDAAS